MTWRIWRTKPRAVSVGCRRLRGTFSRRPRLRLDCKRRGIMRLDVGPEAVAATFLPGRLRKSKAKSLERDGDRVVYAGNCNARPFDRISDLLELLDD